MRLFIQAGSSALPILAANGDGKSCQFVPSKVQSVSHAASLITISADPYQGVGMLEEAILERNYNGLKLAVIASPGLLQNVLGNSGHVCRIQCCINLVQHKEWRWLEAVDGKKEGQSSHRLADTTATVSVTLVYTDCLSLHTLTWLAAMRH